MTALIINHSHSRQCPHDITKSKVKDDKIIFFFGFDLSVEFLEYLEQCWYKSAVTCEVYLCVGFALLFVTFKEHS